MTDMQTISSSPSTTTTNSSSSSSSSSVPSDLNNINNLTNYVNTIFRQMEEKFMAASDQVMNRMNELGKRIDTLETNIGDIISHLPTEETTISSSQQQQTKP